MVVWSLPQVRRSAQLHLETEQVETKFLEFFPNIKPSYPSDIRISHNHSITYRGHSTSGGRLSSRGRGYHRKGPSATFVPSCFRFQSGSHLERDLGGI